jgi:catechol 2,3-dioxygenase-like lactoylglutathione lyase family enzyme
MMETTAPILPARDLAETSEFYQSIGFTQTGIWPDQYLIIVRDKVELHFFHHPEIDPLTSHFMAYIRTNDVNGLSEEIAKLGLPDKGHPRFGVAEDKEWGMRELVIIDPNGTLLRIGQFL